MPICNHLAPNGEKSILYQQLEQKYGADKAHDMWTAIRTQQFYNKHGDWSTITHSSNEAEVIEKIGVVQQEIDVQQGIIDGSRAAEYSALAQLSKPSMKLALIPNGVLVAANSAADRIAHDKIVKEATALQQLITCL